AMTPASFQLALLATVWTELIVIILIAVNVSATAVSREREDGTLDLILTTPITPAMYLSGKLRGLIAYLLPLLAVPIGTLLAAGLYVLTDGLGKGGVTVPVRFTTVPTDVPMVLPFAGLTAALVLIPFIAFCVMIGLHWSLKSKGTIGSVVGTVGVVGVIAGIVGLCGWKSADIQGIGPMLAALNPASFFFASIFPEAAMSGTLDTGPGGVAWARVALAIGAACAGAIHMGVVVGIRAALVRSFDFTVRKLAGTR
ncbi:MAG: ABC transporter permease subunit, partial [Salinibacterium sp.]|nr:ABC transporter permease subunit [Salinibacterium sp.]